MNLETNLNQIKLLEFTSDNVIVSEGDVKKAVFVELKITVAGVMTHLYIMANVA